MGHICQRPEVVAHAYGKNLLSPSSQTAFPSFAPSTRRLDAKRRPCQQLFFFVIVIQNFIISLRKLEKKIT